MLSDQDVLLIAESFAHNYDKPGFWSAERVVDLVDPAGTWFALVHYDRGGQIVGFTGGPTGFFVARADGQVTELHHGDALRAATALLKTKGPAAAQDISLLVAYALKARG